MDELCELRAPMEKKCKTRYFTHLLNDFTQKWRSFHFKVFFVFAFKSKAPTFWIDVFDPKTIISLEASIDFSSKMFKIDHFSENTVIYV